MIDEKKQEEETEQPERVVGQKLQKYGKLGHATQEEIRQLDDEKHLTRVGQRIGDSAEIREGWMTVDRKLLGERDVFYPEEWEFRIKKS